jgi:hypothetical protein
MDQAGIDVEAVESLGEMPTALKFAELLIQECTSLLFSMHMPVSVITFVIVMKLTYVLKNVLTSLQ